MLWLVLLWAIAAVIYLICWQDGAFKPNNAFVLRSPEWVACEVAKGVEFNLSDTKTIQGTRLPGETQLQCFEGQPEAASYPDFNALIYSADVLVPLVSLELQEYWLPDARTPRGMIARWVHWFRIIAGWGLSLLAVAGFSGLVRPD